MLETAIKDLKDLVSRGALKLFPRDTDDPKNEDCVFFGEVPRDCLAYRLALNTEGAQIPSWYLVAPNDLGAEFEAELESMALIEVIPVKDLAAARRELEASDPSCSMTSRHQAVG